MMILGHVLRFWGHAPAVSSEGIFLSGRSFVEIILGSSKKLFLYQQVLVFQW
jgi:hypothetical protein